MNQHTVKAYGDELNQLTAEVARMGGLAEAQVADAVESVARRDIALAHGFQVDEHEAATGAPRTPIAMLSANAMDQHRQDALEAGADVHIAKPINAERLIGGIQAALGVEG